MKKLILLLAFFQFSFNSLAQTILSNEISWFRGIYEQIDFYDEAGDKIVSVAPRFYKQQKSKKWIKPIKVNGQSYLIKRKGRFGMQSVYTSDGEHRANIDKNGSQIDFVQEGITYKLKYRFRLLNRHILECLDVDGELVSTISWQNFKNMAYEISNDQDHNLFLMSLCAHQYQEFLVGERARDSLLTTGSLLLF